jgi:hypothetical protein
VSQDVRNPLRAIPALLATAALAACAKQQPDSGPEPATRTTVQTPAQQQGQPEFLQPSDADYVSMVVAATGWARKANRSLGVLQVVDDHWLWKEATEAASQTYGLRPIQPKDYSVVCSPSPHPQVPGAAGAKVCSLKYVEAVLVFNVAYVLGDKGFVGIGIARVPAGGTEAETRYQCVTMTRNGKAWDVGRVYAVRDGRSCPHE